MRTCSPPTSSAPGSPVAGKAYFITNGEPVDLWEFLNRVLALAGLPPVTKSVSVWKARLAGRVLEFVYRVLRLSAEPAMTRFVASQLATSHWYDISAARRDLGYEPKVGLEDGLRRLAESLQRSSLRGPRVWTFHPPQPMGMAPWFRKVVECPTGGPRRLGPTGLLDHTRRRPLRAGLHVRLLHPRRLGERVVQRVADQHRHAS